MSEKLSQSLVERWISLMTGTFTLAALRREYGVESEENKAYLRVVMGRLVEQGILVSLGKDGTYRKVDSDAKPMDWQSADPKKTLPLKFPFGIEEFCKIFRKSVIVLTGGKNQCKTAWLYNFIALNMNAFGVDLYNSETGVEQMKERFAPLNIPTPAPFRVFERYDNFADVIDPNRISVIDYLDLNSEVYLVGEEIDRMFRKLDEGAVVVAIQKPPPSVTFVKGIKKVIERDLGYGGAYSAKRAVLYISLSPNRLKLVYVKTRRSPAVNPNNATWSFRIADDGVHFENVQRYYGEEEVV